MAQRSDSFSDKNWMAGLLHLDIAVADLDAAVGWALTLGARQADYQPQEHVRVMLDPIGHPFCLFANPTVPDPTSA